MFAKGRQEQLRAFLETAKSVSQGVCGGWVGRECGLICSVDRRVTLGVNPRPMVVSGEDTISAIATPPGSGGIGVVRISGPQARGVLEQLWRGSTTVSKFEPRRLYLGEISDPMRQELRLDKILAVFMPAPRTYTGQDVVELSCHGSPVMLARILEACVSCGSRIADPGEFTRRAFLAGKLDLAQAEGVCDLISAASDRAARLASSQLDGRLSAEVTAIGSELADIRAFLEASIDFPEEDIQGDGIVSKIEVVAARAGVLASTFREGRMVREGVRVAIVGPVNAGKSSILNKLAGCDRALVHSEPGTTRDVVEELVEMGGSAFRLRDTAGFRDGVGGVEAMGTKLSRNEIKEADVILAVFDGSAALSSDDMATLAEISSSAEGKAIITILNKSDLRKGEFDLSGMDNPIHSSAISGEGMDEIRAAIKKSRCAQEFGSSVVVTSLRHKGALDSAVVELERAAGSMSDGLPPECVAQNLRSAQDYLGEITGKVVTEELLDRIFSTFCIGK
jgi:tRNA modification GTPase